MESADSYRALINQYLERQPEHVARHLVPVQQNRLLSSLRDGLLLAALMHLTPSGGHILPEDQLNCVSVDSEELNKYQMLENHSRVLKACQQVGLVLVNVGEDDLLDAENHVAVTLGLIRQILRFVKRARVESKRPSFSCDEAGLVQFVNSFVEPEIRINNIGTDLRNGRVLLKLIHAICPDLKNEPLANSNLPPIFFANTVVKSLSKLRIQSIITAQDILQGNTILLYDLLSSLMEKYDCELAPKDQGQSRSFWNGSSSLVPFFSMALGCCRVWKKDSSSDRKIDMEVLSEGQGPSYVSLRTIP